MSKLIKNYSCELQSIHPSTGIPLPPEILLQVFNFLNLNSVCASSCVSGAWNKVSETSDENLWKSLCLSTCNGSFKLRTQSWRNATLSMFSYCNHEESQYSEYNRQLEYWRLMNGIKSELELEVNPTNQNDIVPFSKKVVGGFKVHPDSSDNVTATFGVDLVTSAKDLYCLLYSCKARERGLWLKDQVYLEGALTRYFKFLALKSKYPNSLLIPTMDIEYIWQLHMCRPKVYVADCMKYFGRVLDHKLRLNRYETLVRSQAIIDTANLWRQTYNEEYGIDLTHVPVTTFDRNTVNKVHHKKDGLFSGTWNGLLEFPDQKKPINVNMKFSNKGKVKGSGNEGSNKINLRGSWSKNGNVIIRSKAETLMSKIKYEIDYVGNIVNPSLVEGSVCSSERETGKFRMFKQTLPVGVWEGHVQWVSGTFNSQPLSANPEYMRVFLVFDNKGGMYGGGTQRFDSYEVRISGTYDTASGESIEFTKLTIQRSTGALNGYNRYFGKFDGDKTISGRITREGTNWLGAFSITYQGLESANNQDQPISWSPPTPAITKLTTQMGYFDELWQKGDSPSFERPPLGITVQDVMNESTWLDYYCAQVYGGLIYYPSEDHLSQSIKSYERMLFLSAKHASLAGHIYPSFAVDLIWRAHQIHPHGYKNDCEGLTTRFLGDRPEMQDPRSDERVPDQFMKSLWNEEFSKEMYIKTN